MAPNDDMTVGAVKPRQLYSIDPISAVAPYEHTQSLSKTAERPTAEVMQGYWFTQGGIAEGFNPFSYTADITQEGNGALGTICQYTQDENGNLVPPTRTFTLTA